MSSVARNLVSATQSPDSQILRTQSTYDDLVVISQHGLATLEMEAFIRRFLVGSGSDLDDVVLQTPFPVRRLERDEVVDVLEQGRYRAVSRPSVRAGSRACGVDDVDGWERVPQDLELQAHLVSLVGGFWGLRLPVPGIQVVAMRDGSCESEQEN